MHAYGTPLILYLLTSRFPAVAYYYMAPLYRYLRALEN